MCNKVSIVHGIKAAQFQKVTITVFMPSWYKVILKPGTTNLNIDHRMWEHNRRKNILIRFYRFNTWFWNECALRISWKMLPNCKCQSCKKQRFKSSLCIHRSMTQSPYLEYNKRTFKDKSISGPKFLFTSFNYLETYPFSFLIIYDIEFICIKWNFPPLGKDLQISQP